MKTVRGAALSLTIYYTIISKNSKIRKKYKNGSIVKRSTDQAADIIPDACLKLENYPIKLLENMHLQQLYIIPLFENFKNSPKIQK